MVFAPANVGTVATTVYLSGRILVDDRDVALRRRSECRSASSPDPSPSASTRVPFGIDATTLPVLASTTTDVLLQPEKMRFVALS